jgi:hypothetical protein
MQDDDKDDVDALFSGDDMPWFGRGDSHSMQSSAKTSRRAPHLQQTNRLTKLHFPHDTQLQSPTVLT